MPAQSQCKKQCEEYVALSWYQWQTQLPAVQNQNKQRFLYETFFVEIDFVD